MNQSNPTVILGGGFTGLFTALHLCRQPYPHPVILIDQKERFVFTPLLYELLSGEMNVNQVSPRYEQLLDSGVTFVQDTVHSIDLQQRQIKLVSGLRYTYSKLVLALGSSISYFGVEGAKENSIGFRTDEDAIALGQHLRQCLQRASQTQDPQQRRSLLTVAVIGAGPSGVEMAATLADLLPRWYEKLGGNLSEIRVVMLNRTQEILKGDVNSQLRTTAQKALQQRTVPVQLLLEASVSVIRPHQVEYKRHNQIKTLPAATIIWTGGNTTHPIIKHLPISPEHRDRSDRLLVSPMLQLLGFPEVFAGGDCVAEGDNPLPLTAQVACQQGVAIARNLKAIAKGNNLQPAKVNLRGTLLKLGLGESATNLANRLEITGRLGHLIRQATYLQSLPTPVHNFKINVEWLTDEIFNGYTPTAKQKHSTRFLRWSSAIAAMVLISSSLLIWRNTQLNQFSRVWQQTGIPDFIEQLLEPESQ